MPTTTTVPLPIARSGINLDTVLIGSGDFLMADMIRSCDGYTGCAMDASDDPTGDFSLRVVIVAAAFRGTARLTFKGKASVAAGGATVQAVPGRSTVYDPATDTSAAILTATGGDLTLYFTGTRRAPSDTTATGIRDLHLMRPVDVASPDTSDAAYLPVGTLFNPAAIAALSTFDEIRFMDPLEVNNVSIPVTEWADRTLITDRFQGAYPRAVSLELCVALCNATGCTAWLNIPGGASDDYATKYAQLVRWGSDGGLLPYTGPAGPTTAANPRPQPAGGPLWKGLRADLVAKYEVANETWNYGTFPATSGRNWLILQASPPDYPARYGLAPGDPLNTITNLQKTQVVETVRISAAIRAVYGADFGTRARVVLGCQQNDDPALPARGSMDEMLEFATLYYSNAATPRPAGLPAPRPLTDFFQVISPGGYRLFSIAQGSQYVAVDAQDALAKAPAGFAPDPAKDDTANGIDAVYAGGIVAAGYRRSALIARLHGLECSIYEACLNHGSETSTEFALAVNRDPRMEALTAADFRESADAGIATRNHYNTTRGNWGLWQSIYETPSARLRGLRAVSARAGHPYTPQMVVQDAGDEDLHGFGGTDIAAGRLIPCLDFRHFAAPTRVNVSLRGSRTDPAATGPAVALVVDGSVVATARLPHPDADRIGSATATLSAAIPAGVRSIALRALAGISISQQGSDPIRVRVPGPASPGDPMGPADDFSTLADGAALQSEAGGAWANSSNPGAALIRDAARGGVRAAPGMGGKYFLYGRSGASSTGSVAAEVTWDLGPDVDFCYVELNAPGGASTYAMVNGASIVLAVNGGQGQVATLTAASGIRVALRLEWYGGMVAVLVNGFELIRTSTVAVAVPGITARLWQHTASDPVPATANLVRSFRFGDLATGPTIDPDTGTGTAVGDPAAVGRLLRQLRRTAR